MFAGDIRWEVGAFYLPSVGRKEDIEAGMAGKRTDLYQIMLAELTEQIQFMDDFGYYGVGTTEHHFHIEGEEVSTNPVMLNVYFGSKTKNMKFGQLGNVLPCTNPINRAEDIAMMSQMLQGRAFCRLRPWLPATLGKHPWPTSRARRPWGWRRVRRTQTFTVRRAL